MSRYPTKRVITIAYYALVKPEDYTLHPGFTAADAQWFKISEVPPLPYDHQQILQEGMNYLKHKVRNEPIGFNLIPKKFTLLQLQQLYEAILEVELDKRNFRKKILSMDLLIKLDESQKNVAHRAARLYKFDKIKYKELVAKGFIFEF
mgnify:CR=1 FL=1